MTQVTPAIEPEPALPPRHEAAFFSWIRRLGIPRLRGWLGGVCAGIAARIGVDPVIVRGIFVVAAVLGFPALILYAIAWALLPAADGRILLQQLGRGRFDPALIAIAVMGVVGVVPLATWLWLWLGAPGPGGFTPYDGLQAVVYSPLAAVIGAVLFWAAVAVVVILIVWLVVRAATRSRGGSVPVPRSASANAAAPGPSSATAPYALYRAPAADGEPDDVDTRLGRVPHLDGAEAASIEPVALGNDAEEDELARWREKHEQWRIEHDAWRRRQTEADAAARELARLEREATAQAFAAEVAERRRIRRATNPRASAVFVLAVVGAALVTGAATALAVGDSEIGAPAGVLAAGLIAAIGMVIAGAARRRSGFLAFTAAGLVFSGVLAGFVGSTSTILWGDSSIAQLSTAEQAYVQPFGHTDIQVFDIAPDGFEVGPIVLRKGAGETTISVQQGATLDLVAGLGDGIVEVVRVDPETGELVSTDDLTTKRTVDGVRHFEQTVVGPGANADASATVPVRIEQLRGSVRVIVVASEQED